MKSMRLAPLSYRGRLRVGLAAWAALGAGTPGLASAAPHAPELHTALIYEGRLYLKVLDLRTDSHVTARWYVSGARAASTGVLAFFKKLAFDARAQGAMVDGWPMPVRVVQETFDGRKRKRVATQWTWRAAEARSHAFGSADPLTQFLRIVLTPMTARPCVGPVPIYDGRQRYLLDLTGAGPGQLAPAIRQQGLTDPVRCRVGFHPLAGFSRAAGPQRQALRGQVTATFARAPAAGVWVLTDMEADTLIGPAHLQLTRAEIQGGIGALAPPKRPVRVEPRNRRRR